jgi:hypothetical protein
MFDDQQNVGNCVRFARGDDAALEIPGVGVWDLSEIDLPGLVHFDHEWLPQGLKPLKDWGALRHEQNSCPDTNTLPIHKLALPRHSGVKTPG